MVTENTLKCFKAYDIRGKLGDELNPDVAYRIGYAYAKHLNSKKLWLAVISGIQVNP